MFDGVHLIRTEHGSSSIGEMLDKIKENPTVILPTFLTPKNDMLYFINNSDTTENVGLLYLYDINLINQSAWIDGFVIDDQYKDKLIAGYVQLIYMGMTKMGLNKISAKYLVGNNYYKRIYDFLRFTIEGTLRDEVMISDKFRSIHVRSLLKHEFKRYYLSGDHINKMCRMEDF